MYGIIHTKIFDSTVMAEGYQVAYVFISLVTLADENHICDFAEVALAQRLFMPLHKLKEALDILQQPDAESKSQAYEGRRIIALKDMDEYESNRGWLIVNREDYIRMASKEYRQAKNRERQQRKRDKDKESVNKSVTEAEMSRTCHDNINININKIDSSVKKRFKPPLLDDVKAYCNERNNDVDANKFIDFYTAKDWMIGRNKMKDWKAAVRTWESKSNKEEKIKWS